MAQLLKFKDDYADEFDVEAFVVTDEQNVANLFTAARIFFELIPGECEIGFGTNEWLTFNNYEEFRECFEVVDITDEELKMYMKHFSCRHYEDWYAFHGLPSSVFDTSMFLERILVSHGVSDLSEQQLTDLRVIEPDLENYM